MQVRKQKRRAEWDLQQSKQGAGTRPQPNTLILQFLFPATLIYILFIHSQNLQSCELVWAGLAWPAK